MESKKTQVKKGLSITTGKHQKLQLFVESMSDLIQKLILLLKNPLGHY